MTSKMISFLLNKMIIREALAKYWFEKTTSIYTRGGKTPVIRIINRDESLLIKTILSK